MTSVLAVGALGSIMIICAVFFLRRLLGELAELRREITRVDREMRAQRARVNFMKLLITKDQDDEDDGGPPTEAAVVNGHEAGLPPGLPAQPDGPAPVRRKRHLGLYIGGGLAAALTTLTTAARDTIRASRHQFIAAMTGAAVTAAAVTLVTVQPWTNGSDHQPPSAAPTAAQSPAYTPPGSSAAPKSPSAAEPEPRASESPTASPSEATSPTVEPIGSIVPIGDEPTIPGLRGAPGQSRRPTEPPGRATPPGQTRRPVAPGHTGAPGRPSEVPGRGRGLSADVVLPLLEAEVCIMCG